MKSPGPLRRHGVALRSQETIQSAFDKSRGNVETPGEKFDGFVLTSDRIIYLTKSPTGTMHAELVDAEYLDIDLKAKSRAHAVVGLVVMVMGILVVAASSRALLAGQIGPLLLAITLIGIGAIVMSRSGEAGRARLTTQIGGRWVGVKIRASLLAEAEAFRAEFSEAKKRASGGRP